MCRRIEAAISPVGQFISEPVHQWASSPVGVTGKAEHLPACSSKQPADQRVACPSETPCVSTLFMPGFLTLVPVIPREAIAPSLRVGAISHFSDGIVCRNGFFLDRVIRVLRLQSLNSRSFRCLEIRFHIIHALLGRASQAMSELSSNPNGTNFSFTEARKLIGDLTKPKPWVYWVDFVTSIVLGHAALHLVFIPRWYGWTPLAIAGLLISYALTVILYMRALMFIHELVHLPKKGFRGFRIAWNAMAGIFFLVPSFLYYPHVDHHRRKHYGTDHDGEYLPLSHLSPWLIVGFIVQALLIPFLAIARFLIISPICWICPPARRFTHRHMSTMLVDPFYERPDGSPKMMRIVIFQEFLCFAWLVWFFIRGVIMRG